MATVQRFEELQVWKDARELCKEIQQITENPKFARDIRFVSQIRAAAGSIMDNIAEGYERDGNKEFIQFLYIAKGSSGEVRSQLARAYDNEYITSEIYDSLYQQVHHISIELANFIAYIKRSALTGQKYKNN